MSIYILSDILSSDFTEFCTEMIPVEESSYKGKSFKFSSTGKKGHYGLNIFKDLDLLLPTIWEKTNMKESDINNTNTGKIAWYLDGMELFTLKHNLKDTLFSIKDDDPASKSKRNKILYIQKPSHLHIGSGKLITIGDDKNKMKKTRPDSFKLFPQLPPVKIEHWVVQPLIKSLLWKDDRKFDTRFYSVVFNFNSDIYVWCYKYGIGRICVNKYNPEDDYTSAVTNISIQEVLKGYSREEHLPLIYDNNNMLVPIMKSVIKDLNITSSHHMLILGLDIIFLEDGTPRIIEINHEPALELYEETNEKICSMGVINTVFGNIIPNILQTRLPYIDTNWNIFMV